MRERHAAALERIGGEVAAAGTAEAPFARYHAEWMRFAVGYLDAVAATREGDIAEAAGSVSDALADATGAVQAYASVATDNSDRGAIASINEYCIRFLRTTRDRLAE